MLAYDTARAVFRAAKARDAGAIILEIARSEIAYTDQRPAEYVAVMIGAALREGYQLPLFIQGDHCQVNAKKFAANPEAEVGEVKNLIGEEIAVGLLQYRCRHLDARRPLVCHARRAAAHQLSARRRDHPVHPPPRT